MKKLRRWVKRNLPFALWLGILTLDSFL